MQGTVNGRSTCVDTSGVTEIGYIFILVITALILTSMTMVVASIMQDASHNALETQLQQVDTTLRCELNDAIHFALTYPTCHYSKNITMPRTLNGDPYTICFSGSHYYINTTAGDIGRTARIDSPGITLTGQVTNNGGVVRLAYSGGASIRIE